jgi:hypothetical protein
VAYGLTGKLAPAGCECNSRARFSGRAKLGGGGEGLADFPVMTEGIGASGACSSQGSFLTQEGVVKVQTCGHGLQQCWTPTKRNAPELGGAQAAQ